MPFLNRDETDINQATSCVLQGNYDGAETTRSPRLSQVSPAAHLLTRPTIGDRDSGATHLKRHFPPLPLKQTTAAKEGMEARVLIEAFRCQLRLDVACVWLEVLIEY